MDKFAQERIMTQDIQYHMANLDLTFSQRVGAAPLPDPIKPEHLSRRFRIRLDYQFGKAIDVARGWEEDSNSYVTSLADLKYGPDFGTLLWQYRMNLLDQFQDEIDGFDPNADRSFISDLMKTGEYHEVLTLCEYFLRNAFHLSLKPDIEAVFANIPSAYKIGYAENNVPFIYPVNQASAEAVAKALDRLNSAKQNDILSKFGEAASKLNNQEYLASAKFGIDAVYVSGSQLAPDKTNFGQILSEIVKKNLLPNNETRQILDKINAYANKYVRHPKEDTPNIERDEAIYFFGICAVTADYLASKHNPNNPT